MNQDPKGPVPFRSVQTRFSVSHIILARTKKISISEWCEICGWSVPMFWWKRFFLSCPVQTWDANVCLYLFRFLCANLNMTLRLWTLTGPVFRISYLLLASDKKFCGVKSACHGPNHCFRMCIFFFLEVCDFREIGPFRVVPIGPVFCIFYLLQASDRKFCGGKSACHGPNHRSTM